jgi:sulfofructose kinase
MTPMLVCGEAAVQFLFRVAVHPDMDGRTASAHQAEIVGTGPAANAAVAMSRLGAAVTLVTRLGDDGVGAIIRSDLVAEGVDCSHVRTFGGGRSPMGTALVDAEGQTGTTHFAGDGLPETGDWVTGLRQHFQAAMADTTWPEGAMALMGLARDRSVPGIVAASGPAPAPSLAMASHVVFTAESLRAFTGESGATEGLAAARQRLPGWLAVALGPQGVLWRDRDGKAGALPTHPVRIVDHSAVHDVWCGAFALALGEGQDEPDAVRFANAVSALKVGRTGGRRGTPTRLETEMFLKRVGAMAR